MVKRLLIIIPTLFLLSASSAFADGNIVAILVALRKQGVCTDSCSISVYESSRMEKILRYYWISGHSISEYESSRMEKILRYYWISSHSVSEYESSRMEKILKYYWISSHSVSEYESSRMEKILKYYRF